MEMKIELSIINIQGLQDFLEWLKKCPLKDVEISIDLFKILKEYEK